MRSLAFSKSIGPASCLLGYQLWYLLALVNGLSDRCINQVFNLSARVARRHLRQDFRVHQLAARDFVKIKLKNFFSAVDVGPRDVDFLVEPSRSGGGRVQRVLMVSGADDADVVVLLETVHF